MMSLLAVKYSGLGLLVSPVEVLTVKNPSILGWTLGGKVIECLNRWSHSPCGCLREDWIAVGAMVQLTGWC